MGIIKAARELGKAIQADERYIEFNRCRKANDEDEKLQEQIHEFNLVRMQAAEEANKDDNRDEERFKQLNAKMRQIYADIMVNENMIAYNKAKGEMDALLQNMNGIIDLCIQGEDPDTCEPSSGCTGSCATCGGCH